MDDQPDPKKQRKPWITPRVLQVQRRADGDNLAVGCKATTGPAVDGSCEASLSFCQDTGS